MVRYILQQIKITSSKAYGKWYAKNVVEETIDLDGLSEHMSHHNSPYSKGVIKGLLTDMIQCIKELLLQGMNVKIDDLAIFSLGIKNKKGGATETQMMDKEFNPTSLIAGVHVRFSPESSALDNLTSKQFLTRSVTAASQNIVKSEERTINGKTRKIRTVVSLDDFRNPNGSAAPSGPDTTSPDDGE